MAVVRDPAMDRGAAARSVEDVTAGSAINALGRLCLIPTKAIRPERTSSASSVTRLASGEQVASEKAGHQPGTFALVPVARS
jgi:hypothetical protein